MIVFVCNDEFGIKFLDIMKKNVARSFFVKKTDDGADFIGSEENQDVLIHAAAGSDEDNVAFFDAEREESFRKDQAVVF